MSGERSRSASRSDRFPAVMFQRLPKPSLLVFRRGIQLHNPWAANRDPSTSLGMTVVIGGKSK